jgi:hypothetical protein
MEEDVRSVRIRATLDIPAQALETIVHRAKAMVGPDARGHYRVDTADLVGELIGRFLRAKGFEAFVDDPANYPSLE